MKPLDGDAGVLLRAGRRCGVLARELDRLEMVLGGAADGTAARWSGTGAAAFGAMAHAHRTTVHGTRLAVERLGSLTNGFAHELADAQEQAKRLPEDASVERQVIEDRINELRRRYQQQAMRVESELKQVLLRRPVDPPRWTGPVRPPGGLVRGRPIQLPPLSGPVRDPGEWPPSWPFEPPPLSGPVCPPRWTGPIRPPVNTPQPPVSIRPLPVPVDQGPGAAHLPWTPPWLNGTGPEPTRTLVQPVKAGT